MVTVYSGLCLVCEAIDDVIIYNVVRLGVCVCVLLLLVLLLLLLLLCVCVFVRARTCVRVEREGRG